MALGITTPFTPTCIGITMTHFISVQVSTPIGDGIIGIVHGVGTLGVGV